jgi:hypothetical protein
MTGHHMANDTQDRRNAWFRRCTTVSEAINGFKLFDV